MRRKSLKPGTTADVAAEPRDTEQVELSELEWRVLTLLKREFAAEEIVCDTWVGRAREARVSLGNFAALLANWIGAESSAVFRHC